MAQRSRSRRGVTPASVFLPELEIQVVGVLRLVGTGLAHVAPFVSGYHEQPAVDVRFDGDALFEIAVEALRVEEEETVAERPAAAHVVTGEAARGLRADLVLL